MIWWSRLLLANNSNVVGERLDWNRTGFSTTILCYNPEYIIDYTEALVRKSTNLEAMPLSPYYEDFAAPLNRTTRASSVEYLIRRVYEMSGNTIRITELPIGTWTSTIQRVH